METEPTRVIVCLADTIGEHLPQKFEILGLHSIGRAIGSFITAADYAWVMDVQAADLVEVLATHLPQGTWARVVAYVAQRWAEDEHQWTVAADNFWRKPVKDTASEDQTD